MSKFRFRGASIELIEQARRFRKAQTTAEELLWEVLRDRQLAGIKFRRQHPVSRFIFDFYCPAARLVIELDGPVHDPQRERDEARTAALESRNFRVIRFRNEEVFDALPSVLDRIVAAVEQDPRSHISPSPAQFAGEGAGG
ncbi:MAG TPA: endonuclease domain-containing protein [Longimicrobium sp.]|jgi:very-short-patch-repair endonuclease|uniref:endonuclease domain-containing protein n=1 Tax=Longimicrobium sp. TaxID=2029185 RepID=UPI002EDA46DC